VLAIIVGVLAFMWPGKTFEAFVLLFGVFAFVCGSIWLSFSLLAAGAHDRWWPLVVNGAVGTLRGIVIWFLLQLVNGIAGIGTDGASGSGVAYWAHVGGFLTGVVLVRLFAQPGRVEQLQRLKLQPA
jgi:membrane associated rhomboid family serine protease